MRSLRRWWRAGSVLAGIILVAGCSAPPLDAPPVLLISFDTCRADLFGTLTGEKPSLTPYLDALAGDSVVFENAFVQAPHTLPSHMSLMTSVYPDVHGVKPDERVLPDSLTTLPEVLRNAGYHTVGIVTSEWLEADFGFGRGFRSYRRLDHEPTYVERVNDVALDQLERFGVGDAPAFFFLHYYDLHSDFDHGSARNKLPYYSPPEYRHSLEVSVEGFEFCDQENQCNTRYLIAADKERRPISDAEIQAIHELYRAAVRHLDDQMGAFVTELKRRGVYDQFLIIITSDHGEEFREHGRFIHSQPYDETIRMPLFLKFPSSWKAGTRYTEVVETVDLMPTILDFLGIESPEYLQGESLMGLIDGETGHKNAVFSQDTINLSRYAMRTTTTKFIMDLRGTRYELYDLLSDPQEQHNTFNQNPLLAKELEDHLRRVVEANREFGERLESVQEEVLSDEERERLRALGYVD